MTEERGLQRIDQTRTVGIGAPDEILENAIVAAKALQRVVNQKKKPVIFNGEQYLEFEDWQTCGQFYRYTVKTYEAMPVEVDGIKGAKARADLIDLQTGEVLGGAEAYCMRDEEKWNTRPKYEWAGKGDGRHRIQTGTEIVPWFQLASMAQTRAGAKAFRNRLAWVAVLAGYRPTPAEEMTEDTATTGVKERRTVEDDKHWCAIHHTAFFKKGEMRGYAHPIGDTGEWCNEGEPEEAKPELKQSKTESATQQVKTSTPDTETGTEPQPPPVSLVAEARKLGAVESITSDQAKKIKDYVGRGINVGEYVKLAKLTATSTKDMSKKDAETIINLIELDQKGKK